MKKRVLLGIAWGFMILFLVSCHSEKTAKSNRQTIRISQTKKDKKVTKNKIATVKNKKTQAKPWKYYQQPIKIPILMYHSISSGNSLRVPPAQFAAEIAALKQAGYYSLSATEAVKAFTTNSLPQAKCVWITLDDGYSDNYSAAFPILKKYHYKATINYITGFEQRNGYLTVEQMKQMRATGLISFASHTVDHLDLNELPAKQQWQELDNAKQTLDSQLNQNTQVIAYPAGRYDQQTLQLVKKCNYQLGLTTHPGLAQKSQGFYSLDRVRITPGLSTEQFLFLVKNG